MSKMKFESPMAAPVSAWDTRMLSSVGFLPSAHPDPAALHPRDLVQFQVPSNGFVSSSLLVGLNQTHPSGQGIISQPV